MVSSSGPVFSSAVPRNFPLPSHHPWIRLTGLHSWFRTLAHEDSVVFHRFLLNFDINQQTPAEALYKAPLQTDSVIAVYDMSTGSARVMFDELVRWSGVPDQKPAPVPFPPVGDGFGSKSSQDCYKCLFRNTPKGNSVSSLGLNPWASTVAAALLGEPGVWAEGKFRLSFGFSPEPAPSGSAAFTQAHVEPCPDGMTVRQLLPLLTGHVRLGATDLMAALSIAEQSEAPAVKQVFDIKPKGASHQMSFAVYGIVGANVAKYPSIAFTPLTSPVLTVMLGVYESVRLDSAEFVITVDKGSGNSVWCAMVSAGTSLNSVDDWYSSPVMSQVDGSDTGVVRGKFAMPSVVMFSREYRATTLGNPPAKFVFAYTGAAETNGTIQGVFTVTVSGQRLMTRVNIGGGKAMSSVKTLVTAIHGELDYDVDDCDLPPFGPHRALANTTDDDDDE